MRWRSLLIGLLVVAVAVALYGLYLYNKKPPDIKKSASQQEVSAVRLVQDFNNNEPEANKKYLDKILTVNGTIREIKAEPGGSVTVFLESGDPMASVTCSFYENEIDKVRSLKAGSVVKIKGVCTGKLMDVVLNKCSIVD